jgi:AhpD family alkylhydroperoxidase
LAKKFAYRGEEIFVYDSKNVAKIKALDENAPEAMKTFWAFDKAAMTAGVISRKNKELMAVAVALTTQCPYCIDIHAKRAREEGATEQEMAETVAVAAALRAGGAITHGTHAMGVMVDTARPVNGVPAR